MQTTTLRALIYLGHHYPLLLRLLLRLPLALSTPQTLARSHHCPPHPLYRPLHLPSHSHPSFHLHFHYRPINQRIPNLPIIPLYHSYHSYPIYHSFPFQYINLIRLYSHSHTPFTKLHTACPFTKTQRTSFDLPRNISLNPHKTLQQINSKTTTLKP